MKVDGIAVVKTIFKFPQQPSGTSYLASLTIPFEICSFVVKAQCVEAGPTGLRDAMIADRLMASGELKATDAGIQNWAADPYDTSISGRALMNKSEQQIYDTEFPNHPLSRARAIIDRIRKEMVFRPEIKKLDSLKR